MRDLALAPGPPGLYKIVPKRSPLAFNLLKANDTRLGGSFGYTSIQQWYLLNFYIHDSISPTSNSHHILDDPNLLSQSPIVRRVLVIVRADRDPHLIILEKIEVYQWRGRASERRCRLYSLLVEFH